jgi:hypothetical protein
MGQTNRARSTVVPYVEADNEKPEADMAGMSLMKSAQAAGEPGC